MPKLNRPVAFVAVLVAVSLALTGEAGAAPSRSKAAADAARLDTLRATDRELRGAMSALSSQVEAQISRVDAAKRAATSAESAAAAASAALQATQARIDTIRSSVVVHAVNTYMRPQGRNPVALTASNLNESSRQRALWDHVENREVDILDQLHAARQDQAARAAAASHARDRATQRKRDTSAQLTTLATNLRDKNRLSTAMAARIREAQGEDDAANASSLNAILDGADNSVYSKSGFVWPVRGRLTSGFGRRWGRLHAGIDIAAPRGTPIKAARSGKVLFSGWMGGYGNAVMINHGGGIVTLYGHQSRRAVAAGQTVRQGQVIGYVGSTGHSTGNHLHFEVRINGKATNPRRFL